MLTCQFCLEPTARLRTCFTPQCHQCAEDNRANQAQCLPECCFDHNSDDLSEESQTDHVKVVLLSLARLCLANLLKHRSNLDQLDFQQHYHYQLKLIQQHQLLYPQLTTELTAMAKSHSLKYQHDQFKWQRINQAQDFCTSLLNQANLVAQVDQVAYQLTRLEQFLAAIVIEPVTNLMLPLAATVSQQSDITLVHVSHRVMWLSSYPSLTEPDDVYLASTGHVVKFVDLAMPQPPQFDEADGFKIKQNGYRYYDLASNGMWRYCKVTQTDFTAKACQDLVHFVLRTLPQVFETSLDRYDSDYDQAEDQLVDHSLEEKYQSFQIVLPLDQRSLYFPLDYILRDNGRYVVVINQPNCSLSCYDLAECGHNQVSQASLATQPTAKWTLALRHNNRSHHEILGDVQVFTNYLVLFNISAKTIDWYELASGHLFSSTPLPVLQQMTDLQNIETSCLSDGRLHVVIEYRKLLTFDLTGQLQASHDFTLPRMKYDRRPHLWLRVGPSGRVYLSYG